VEACTAVTSRMPFSRMAGVSSASPVLVNWMAWSKASELTPETS